MEKKLFTAGSLDFYKLRQRLFTQYDDIPFDMQNSAESGLSPGELDSLIEKLCTETDSRIEYKSKMLALVMQKARLHSDPADWFCDHFQGRNLVRKKQEEWHKEVKENTEKACGETLRISNAAGAFDADLDLGHTSAGWRFLMENGISGLMSKIQPKIETDDSSKREFYVSSYRVLSALRDMILRFASLAEKNSETAGEFKSRALAQAKCLYHIADNPPKTFYQALQLTYIFHEMVEYEGENLRSMAGFDKTFTPFYQSDIDSGEITREDAKELIRFFWMKFFAKTKGVSNGKNFYFGGLISPDTDGCTELTYLAMECFYELEQTDPKFSIRFHKNSPEELYRHTAKCIRDGRTGMVLINDDTAIPAIRKMGKDEADVYDYVLIGCYEPAIEGREIACNMSIRINLAKPIELVFGRGTDPVTGETIGPDTGPLENMTDYEAFKKAYFIQLNHEVTSALEAIKTMELHWAEINPSPLLSSTFTDCLESGNDISAAGAKYNNTGCMGGCLANAADSLVAVKRLVYDEGKLSLPALKQILDNDYEGSEKLQTYIKNRIPKWGNNNEEADLTAKEIADYYTALVNQTPNNRGGIFVASMFSLDHNIPLGKHTGALPDGRNAGVYLSRGIGAMTAMDKAGVTAHIQSVTKLDFTNIPNGSVLDIYLHPSAVAGEQGLQALIGLIKTYFAKGGYGIQFNILDTEDLRRAQKEPEKYSTLQVRLCGWNVYFVSLSPEAQEQFIDTLMQVL